MTPAVSRNHSRVSAIVCLAGILAGALAAWLYSRLAAAVVVERLAEPERQSEARNLRASTASMALVAPFSSRELVPQSGSTPGIQLNDATYFQIDHRVVLLCRLRCK
jgi:uncharacterized iron-regulated membrane protein